MSLSVAIDAVVLIVLVLATWSGWRTGASRMIVSTLATVAGIFLAAQGRAPIAAVVSQLFPDVDALLVSLLILFGATWILLGILSWILGRALRALLHTIRLGLLDGALGALLGLVQALVIFSALLFLIEALRGLNGIPAPLSAIAEASIGSQSADIFRVVIYPIVWSLIGSSLPAELQQILRP